MQSEATPGPWQQSDYCPLEIWGNLQGPLEDGKVHGTHVCTVHTNEADARIILAAPELFKALRELLTCSLPHDVSGTAIIDRARRALLKAM